MAHVSDASINNSTFADRNTTRKYEGKEKEREKEKRHANSTAIPLPWRARQRRETAASDPAGPSANSAPATLTKTPPTHPQRRGESAEREKSSPNFHRQRVPCPPAKITLPPPLETGIPTTTARHGTGHTAIPHTNCAPDAPARAPPPPLPVPNSCIPTTSEKLKNTPSLARRVPHATSTDHPTPARERSPNRAPEQLAAPLEGTRSPTHTTAPAPPAPLPRHVSPRPAPPIASPRTDNRYYRLRRSSAELLLYSYYRPTCLYSGRPFITNLPTLPSPISRVGTFKNSAAAQPRNPLPAALPLGEPSPGASW